MSAPLPGMGEAERRRFADLAEAVCREHGAAPVSFKVGRMGTVLATFRTRDAAESAAAALHQVIADKRVASGRDPIGQPLGNGRQRHRLVWRLAGFISA